MKVSQHHLTAASIALAALAAAGCKDSTDPVELKTGTLEISVSTVSETSELDPGGYTLTIDGGPAQSIGSNTRLTIAALPVGNHYVVLSGITSNCSVYGFSSRLVIVSSDQGALVSFAVTCVTKDGSGAGEWDY